MIIKKTFIFQNTLPALPIPTLKSTQEKLYEWIEPIVSHSQYEETTEVIETFFSENGEGELLQERLYRWERNQSGSWLTPFFDDSYLKHRDGLPYSMNFNVLLKNDAYKKQSVSEIAGKVSFLVTELYHEILDEELEPSLFRGRPLDMSQYKNFFRSIRIPQKKRDVFQVADATKKNNHIVFIYKNHIYKINVSDQNGRIFPSHSIATAIETVMAKEQNEGINVGIFTTTERDRAAVVYEMLNDSKLNAETLQSIAEALIVISLDEESKTSEDAIRTLMIGASNKYFDKTIQVIVTNNRELGFNVEHCAVDGTSVSTVIRRISQGLKSDIPMNSSITHVPPIEKKEWELTAQMKRMLGQFQHEHLIRKDDYALQPKTFTDFGAEDIKKLSLSPDAFFHMALQIAKYRTYGTFHSVYQPVAVRFYYEGRTECARATSMEKIHLVEALESGELDTSALYELMQEASNAHTDRIRECQRGYGIERHLTGLKQMYDRFGKELGLQELPALFQDNGYITLRHDVISTSGMGYEDAKYRMFAPVVRDGHGVAYFLIEHAISINISSFAHNQAKGKELMNHMLEALREMHAIAKEATTCSEYMGQ